MALELSPETLAAIAAALAPAIGQIIDAKIAAVVVPSPADLSPVSLLAAAVVSPKASSVTKATPEQLAADAVDPLRNEYTAIARKYSYELYAPLWTAERDRLVRNGVPVAKGSPTGASKMAAVNITARIKIERQRLKNRDNELGIASERFPVVDAAKIRSVGTHSDSTANQAIHNVEQESREIAALRARLAQLEGTANVVTLPVPVRKERTAASAAQVSVGANPYERTIEKLVADAKASGSPRTFVQNWFKFGVDKSPKRQPILAKQASEACRRLGIPVKA